MLTLDSRLNIPAHVYVTTVDEEIVLLNTRTNKYFALKEVGARAWELLKEKKTLSEIHRVLLGEYEVAADVLEKDILELAEHLLESKLVEVVEE